MKYFKDENNNIYAYSADGSQDAYIKKGLVEYNRAIDEYGSFYSAYLDEPDENGIYQPDLDAVEAVLKSTFSSKMKSRKESLCCAGAIVSMVIDDVEYKGIFCPDDRVMESVAMVGAYREGVDSTADESPVGNVWYTKDEDGNKVYFPMTESRMNKIMVKVRNWHTLCNRVYKECKEHMESLTGDDLKNFDCESYIGENMPSRYITVTE